MIILKYPKAVYALKQIKSLYDFIMLRAVNEQKDLKPITIKNIIWNFSKMFKLNNEALVNLFTLMTAEKDNI